MAISIRVVWDDFPLSRRDEGRILTRDFGDFQTPPALVKAILTALGSVGKRWPRVLEPTCGTGNFIAGLLQLDARPQEIQGLEMQQSHVRAAERVALGASGVRTCIRAANIFQVDLRRDVHWVGSGPLLVLGNPPWVTNAELGSIDSTNLPHKTNQKNLRGIDALTGQSNFDLAEHIWIKIITELVAEKPTIAMLCKTTVARNVLRFAFENSVPVEAASIHKIDARKWFRATVEACLLIVSVGAAAGPFEANVYPDLTFKKAISAVSVQDDSLVWDRERYDRTSAIDGVCSLSWRQGVKHDAAKVMELTHSDGTLRNRLGETVKVEPEYVYPLLKGSDLFNGTDARPRFSVIVTQKHLRENTEELQEKAPKLWAYLRSHEDFFVRRKSSVYAGRSPFCMFGVGEYSFANFKVAIAGFYQTPRFRALGPLQGRPVMLDDTCYFVVCRSAEQAALVTSLLNAPTCEEFLRSLIFPDAKETCHQRTIETRRHTQTTESCSLRNPSVKLLCPDGSSHRQSRSYAEIHSGLLEKPLVIEIA